VRHELEQESERDERYAHHPQRPGQPGGSSGADLGIPHESSCLVRMVSLKLNPLIGSPCGRREKLHEATNGKKSSGTSSRPVFLCYQYTNSER
jgi:hypothetical protein